jgi:hypothetical protein
MIGQTQKTKNFQWKKNKSQAEKNFTNIIAQETKTTPHSCSKTNNYAWSALTLQESTPTCTKDADTANK